MTHLYTPEIWRFLLATFAYEVIADPFMTDPEWDALALELEPQMRAIEPTYEPYTGMWIHTMGLGRIEEVYRRVEAVDPTFQFDTILSVLNELEDSKETA